MGLSATINGAQVLSARVNMPASRVWTARIECAAASFATGASVEINIADLVLRGAVSAASTTLDRTTVFVIGGRGNWGREIAEAHYANDAQVKVSTVVHDAARAAGEDVDLTNVPASRRVGPAFVRRRGPASAVLASVVGSAWYVDERGVTRIGRRPARAYGSKYVIVAPLDVARTITIAADSIKDLVPGAIVEGIEAIDVEHTLSVVDGLLTTLWGSRTSTREGGSNRRLDAFASLLEQLDPRRAFRAVYEYRVVAMQGTRVDAQPVLSSLGMPDLERVPMRPGVAGASSILAPGTYVLVAFVNAEPSRPIIIAFADDASEAFLPVSTSVDATGAIRLGQGVRPVAAQGDLAGGIWPIASTQIKVLV